MPAEEAAGAASRTESGAERRARYGLLLVSLLASFIVEGIATGDAAQSVVTALLGATLLISFWAADMMRHRLRRAAVLVLLVVVLVIVATVAGEASTVNGITRLANGALVALTPVAIVIGVRRTLRATGRVTIDVMFGALCLYLLVGMFFAFIYGAVNNLGGAPFFAHGLSASPPHCLYFSFTTLTTTGYGDFTARTNLGHTLANTEQLLGQIYLVTVVAVIVGNIGARREPRS